MPASPRPLRILFVTDFYHPYSGGVEIHVRTIAHELASRGHTVAVATMPTPDTEPDRDADGPVQVFPVQHVAQRLAVGFTHANRPWAPPMVDPVSMVDLRRAVRAFQPDIIHGHDWLSRSVLPRVVSGKIPVVTSLHYYTRTCAKKTLWYQGKACSGPAPAKCLACARDHYGSLKGPVVATGLRIGSKLEDRRSKRFISVSAATEAGNELTGHPKSTVIMNPLPTAAANLTISDSSPADGASALAGLEDRLPEGPFILFVGDIRPEKGLAVLSESVELLRSEFDDQTPLVVVGERMSESMRLPSNTIETGHVSNEAVQQLWRRATVGVIPSQWPEPFGLVAIEAIAAGCPVVASDVGGLSEIFAEGRAELVPPDDPKAFAAAISKLLGDGSLRQELAVRAKQSLGAYGLETIVGQIEAVYVAALDD